MKRTKLLIQEVDIILKDIMLQDLSTIREMKYNCALQEKVEQVKITKHVYNTHNTVFNNLKQTLKPKRKIVLTLHTDQRSSYAQIYDIKGEQIVWSGNSLWAHNSSRTKKAHIDFIKLLHSVEHVKENYS